MDLGLAGDADERDASVPGARRWLACAAICLGLDFGPCDEESADILAGLWIDDFLRTRALEQSAPGRLDVVRCRSTR